MAIKGKSRKRSRARRPALPPKPTLTARKTPLPFRRDVKRGVVIALAILAVLGGLRVWQNVSRTDTVREYNTKLNDAQKPLISHFDPSNQLTNVQQSIQGFTGGQVTPKQFIDLSTLWEKDFRAAKDAVAKLKPPNEVSKQAQALFVEGLDGYVGVARLYNLAGQVKELALAEKDAAKKKALNGRVEVVLQHAEEWVARANAVYKIGQDLFNDLKARYSVEQPIPTST